MNLRKSTIRFLIAIPILLTPLACKASTFLQEPMMPTPGVKSTHTPSPPNADLPTEALPPSATAPPPTASATAVPTSTTSPTNSPTIPPSPTPTPTAEPTAVVTPSKLQEEVFQQLWEAVNQHYLYPDFNGLDWNQVYDEYLGRIRNGLTDEAFYQAMDEMIFSLGDDHSAFFSPSEAVELDEDYAGEYDYVGIGVMSSVVPERERLTILLVFPGSPAEQAGLKAHDSLLAIDGQPLVVDGEARFQLLRGPEGSQIELTVQSPGEDPRPVSLIRQRINSRLPIPYEILSSADEKRIGYLMLPTFHDSYVDEGVESALRAMRADGQLDGLIIDNRYNGGGSSDVLRDALAFFTDGTVGHFVRRNDTRALAINGMSIGGSQNIPLIVLVGPSTASFGEIFSGVLRDVTRAKIIGETTDGNVEILSAFNFSDGSRAWIAYQTFRPLNNPNEDWEQTGIVPDIQAPGGWDQYYLENDPAIIEALRYFDGS